MSAPSEPAIEVPQIDVVNADITKSGADIIVVPATSDGQIGQEWAGALSQTRLQPIKLGTVSMVEVTGIPPTRFLALAGVPQPVSETAIRTIAADLVKQAVSIVVPGRTTVVASPLLGADGDAADFEPNLRALIDGFLTAARSDGGAVAEPLRLDIFESDASRFQRIADQVKKLLSEVPPSPTSGPTADDLDDGASPPAATGRLHQVRSSATDGSDPHARTALYATSVADTVPEPGHGRLRAADRLNIAGDVNMLASVILAKDTSLPLAIGLFGNWGSGKSFFMAQLEERLSEISKDAQQQSEQTGPYCSNVRPIRFNAWHYVDANLWASLASTIFDGLARVDARQTDVAEAQESLLTATDSLVKAHEKRVTAEASLVSAQNQVAARTASVTATVRDVAKAVAATVRSGDRSTTEEEVNASSAAQQVIQSFDELTSLARRLRVVRRLAVSDGRGWLLLAVVGVVVAVVFTLVPHWSLLPKLLGWLAAIAVFPAPLLRKINKWMDVLADAQKQRTQPIREAEEQLAAARQEEAIAQLDHDEKERAVLRLSDRGQRLEDLVRTAALNYRGELGTVSRLRRDFEQLTRLIGPAEEAAPVPVSPALQDEARKLIGTSTGVDRIVLFIDDLDRCSPDNVVKVLQAVHLLLAFRIFVVVVGVDSRWLEASLRAHYDVLLEEPADYLEKIIQIPFLLKTMDEPGFAQLVNELTGSGTLAGPAPAQQPNVPAQRGQVDDDHGRAVQPDSTPSGERQTFTSNRPAPQLPPPPTEALLITEPEQQLLAELGALVITPRAAKRLINIYRILRVSEDARADEHFGPTEGAHYQAVVVLLGVLIGFPKAATSVFATISSALPNTTVWEALSSPSVAESVGPVAQALLPLHPHVQVIDISMYQTWVPRVARFSYR